MIPCPYRTNRQRGFTLIELIMIIVILGILSATIYARWPVGMEEAAAAKEFKRAVRYAQHKAMTRRYYETTPGKAWGIAVAANQYTLRRADGSEVAETEYVNRCLNDDCSTNIAPGTNPFVYFNALGEPINTTDGLPLTADITFTIRADGDGTTVTVRRRTGYVE
ncbi:MAG: type II secretion system protein [Desulfurivibrionaceae bacterium]